MAQPASRLRRILFLSLLTVPTVLLLIGILLSWHYIQPLRLSLLNYALQDQGIKITSLTLNHLDRQHLDIEQLTLKIDDTEASFNHIDLQLKQPLLTNWSIFGNQALTAGNIGLSLAQMTQFSIGSGNINIGPSMMFGTGKAIDSQGPSFALNMTALPQIDIGPLSLQFRGLTDEPALALTLDGINLSQDKRLSTALRLDEHSLLQVNALLDESRWQVDTELHLPEIQTLLAKLSAQLQSLPQATTEGALIPDTLIQDASIQDTSMQSSNAATNAEFSGLPLSPLALALVSYQQTMARLDIDLHGSVHSKATLDLKTAQLTSQHQWQDPGVTLHKLADLRLTPTRPLASRDRALSASQHDNEMTLHLSGHLADLQATLQPIELTLSPDDTQLKSLLNLLNDEPLAQRIMAVSNQLNEPRHKAQLSILLSEPLSVPLRVLSSAQPNGSTELLTVPKLAINLTHDKLALALKLSQLNFRQPRQPDTPLTDGKHEPEFTTSSQFSFTATQHHPLDFSSLIALDASPNVPAKTTETAIDKDKPQHSLQTQSAALTLTGHSELSFINAPTNGLAIRSAKVELTPASQLTISQLTYNQSYAASDNEKTPSDDITNHSQLIAALEQATLNFSGPLSIQATTLIPQKDASHAEKAFFDVTGVDAAGSGIAASNNADAAVTEADASTVAQATLVRQWRITLPAINLDATNIAVTQSQTSSALANSASATPPSSVSTRSQHINIGQFTLASEQPLMLAASTDGDNASTFAELLQHSFQLQHQNVLNGLLNDVQITQDTRTKTAKTKEKQRKETLFTLKHFSLGQALDWNQGQLATQERWQLNDIALNSEHQLHLPPSLVATDFKGPRLKANTPITLTATWHLENQLDELATLINQLKPLPETVQLTGSASIDAKFNGKFAPNAHRVQFDIAPQIRELDGMIGALTLDEGNFSAKCSLNWQQLASVMSSALDCPQLQLTLTDLDPGVPINQLNMQGTLSLTQTDNPAEASTKIAGLNDANIQISATGNILGGQFLLPELSLKLHDKSHGYLVLQGLSLEEVLKIQPQIGVHADGIFDGVLPVDLVDGKASVSGGRLAARAPGGLISVSGNPAVDSMRSSQPYLDFAFSALEHLQYHHLASTFDMTENGDAILNVEVKGKSSGIERPIHLNYTQEENMLQLLKSLQIGDRLQDQIEQSVK